ncbi:MAG: thioredoxin [Oscillospiraceae bacterium]|nr:thioredoxin [Oscillospiraceae bacterium]
MSVFKITKENIKKEVLDSNQAVLLDFWAAWCGPCRMIAPVIEEIAAENPDLKVGKINVDEEPELAEKFGVMSIPTIAVVKGGKVVQKSAGVKPKPAILEMLRKEGAGF